MAMTHDYMDYLEDQIGISPANSQEELQAAQTIADLMRQHDVDVNVEEFDAPGLGRMVRCVLLALMFIGAVLSGTGISAFGVILAVVPAVLLTLDGLGIGGNFLSKLGPSARSQNVVAVHHATGELVAKGNRPIVVVAHYDSPHDSFLYGSPLASYVPMLRKALKWLVPAVGLCALLQVFSLLPAAFRSVLWVAGILLAIPLAAFGADGIYQKFSRCSLGSNDNKSSVAALLGILDNVRPSGEKPVSQRAIEREQREQEAARAAELAASQAEVTPEPVPAPEPQSEEVIGVRHGKDVIAALGILPADCEIEYVDSSRNMRASSYDADETSELPGSPVRVGARIDAETEVGIADSTESLPTPTSNRTTDASVEPAPAAPAANVDATAEVPTPVAADADVDTATPAEDAPIDAPAPAPEKTRFFDRKRLASMFDRFESHGVGEKDDSGLTATPNDDLGSTRPAAPTPRKRPEKPDDPNWGKSNFKPQVSDVARRAALFDLPDPSQMSDPLASDPDATQLAPSHPAAAPSRRNMGNLLSDADARNAQRIRSSVPDPDVPVITPAPATPAPAAPVQEPVDAQQDGLDVISADDLGMQQEPEPEHRSEKHHINFFNRSKDNAGGRSRNQAMRGGNWLSDDPENWDDSSDSDSWKGGATTRSGLRLVDDVPAEASDDPNAAAPADGASLAETPYDAEQNEPTADGAPNEETVEAPADVPTEEDLRAAVLHMGDDELVCHDIWFVALGASDLDHAGMRSFLTEHRSAIRGAFLVNLDCIGAGDLSLLTHEGFEPTRRADRRLLRLLTGTAGDLHVDLKTHTYDWADTDASVAMRTSVRAVTVMGLGENGLPALSRTEQDVPENVDGDQAASVAELVTEMIRRS